MGLEENSPTLVDFMAKTDNPQFNVAFPYLERLMEWGYSLKGSMASIPSMFRCFVSVIT